MRGALQFAVVAYAAALLGACQGSAADDELAAELNDRLFIATKITGHELVPGTELRLGFHSHELSFYAGCNHYSGPFRIEDGALHLNGLGSTEIGCSQELSAQDAWVAAQITAAPKIVLAGDELTLTTKDAKIVLVDREAASPDRPLIGTHWIGNGIGDGQAVSFGPGGSATTLMFGEDGKADVFTSCQHGKGSFTSDATTISFGQDFSYDGAQCSNASLTEVDSQVTKVLDGSTVTYEIEEANLTVKHGQLLLLYREAE